MANISVTESDFTYVSIAARAARDEGDDEMAVRLDILARKINAALSYASIPKVEGVARLSKKPSWKDMPSTLDIVD